MADAISIQELIDARTDAKTLEEAVNGDAVTTVLSRLGETYPTLSNALNQIDSKLDSADAQVKQGITNLFENGGLPATPFKTKALMTASPLVDGKYAMVTDDAVNNGLYVKTAGAWVKSGYDPLAQAKSHTDSTKDFLLNIVYEKLGDNSHKRQAFTFSDKDGFTLGYFDNSSGLRLTSLKNSVQESLSVTALDHLKVTRYIGNHLNVSDAVYPQLMNLMTIGKPIAPVPLECVPTSWTPDDSIIDLKITQPLVHTSIDTPYEPVGEGRVVHPTLIQFKDTFMGYRYIMGLTPFFKSLEKFENPVLYGSNDLVEFDMLAPAPIADQPTTALESAPGRYNSDIFLTYDFQTGELLCGWREWMPMKVGGTIVTFKAKRTKNLIDWSSEEVIYSANVSGGPKVSPSIVYNFTSKMYDMYIWNNNLIRLSSPSLQKPVWTQTANITPIMPGFTTWHIDVRYIGNKLIAVAHDYSATNGNLWSAISSDNGDTWTWAASALLTGVFHKPYKASVIPVFHEDGTYKLQYVWTSANFDADVNNHLKLYTQSTSNITM